MTRWSDGCPGGAPATNAGTCGVDFDPPAQRDTCDRCGGRLFQRDDDQSETVRHRLVVYADQTVPLVDFYADRGILVGIDATGPVEEVTKRAIAALRRFSG